MCKKDWTERVWDSLSELRSSLCEKRTGKDSSEACAIACKNCAVYSVFPSGMTPHSKIAQFNALRRKSAAARLLGSRDRIPLRAWMIVSCVRCVLCRWRPVRHADHSFSGILTDVFIIMCDPRTWEIWRLISDWSHYDTTDTMKVTASDRGLMSYYSGISLRRMRNFTKNLSLHNGSPDRDSNLAHPEYKSEYLPLKFPCSVGTGASRSVTAAPELHTTLLHQNVYQDAFRNNLLYPFRIRFHSTDATSDWKAPRNTGQQQSIWEMSIFVNFFWSTTSRLRKIKVIRCWRYFTGFVA
jgi:hypothetical protein